MPTHLNIKVFGRVQGVFFRYNSVGKAEKLGLTGFVKNNLDGSVYLEVEGNKKVLDKFVAWCRKGPLFARVEKVEISEGPIQNFSEFVIEE